jgi:hypothetical protein
VTTLGDSAQNEPVTTAHAALHIGYSIYSRAWVGRVIVPLSTPCPTLIFLLIIMERFRAEPLYLMDVHSGGAHLTFTIGFIFSGVIDKAQMESATEKVARAWPVLGTRLRRPSPDVRLGFQLRSHSHILCSHQLSRL